MVYKYSVPCFFFSTQNVLLLTHLIVRLFNTFVFCSAVYSCRDDHSQLRYRSSTIRLDASHNFIDSIDNTSFVGLHQAFQQLNLSYNNPTSFFTARLFHRTNNILRPPHCLWYRRWLNHCPSSYMKSFIQTNYHAHYDSCLALFQPVFFSEKLSINVSTRPWLVWLRSCGPPSSVIIYTGFCYSLFQTFINKRT